MRTAVVPGSEFSVVAHHAAEAAVWSQMVALHSRVESAVERALHRAAGIGRSEFVALTACAAAPDGEMRMQDLTDALHLNQSSVSRLVSRLERVGLTERRICEFDRRGIYTGITERGLQTLRETTPVYEASLREAFQQAEADPQLAPLVRAIGALPPAP